MNTKSIGILTAVLASAFVVRAQNNTAFTYQGRLSVGGSPATGIYDLRFTVYDSTNVPGAVVAGPLTNSPTAVSNGLFTTTLDFGGGVFDGNARWLEIGARTNGGGAFTTLSPRQPLTPTPYALFAANAATFGGLAPSAYAPAAGSTAYVAKSGDTMTGDLSVPNHNVRSKGLLASESSDGGGSLRLENLTKTNTAAHLWALYNMAGPYGDTFQIWSYNDVWFDSMFVIYDNGNTILNPTHGKVGIGTRFPSTQLEVQGGPIKAAGGLIVETRTSDPPSPATGQIWLRTDL